MKKLLSLLLTLILIVSSAIVYGQDLKVNSKDALVEAVELKMSERQEVFNIRYKGSENLVNVDLSAPIFGTFGTQQYAELSSVISMDQFGYKYSYRVPTDINYEFTIKYDFNADEFAQLQTDLKAWVEQNISPDMPAVVKTAVISRFISDRMQYKIDSKTNNAFNAYYGKTSACNGYAGLTYFIHQLAGVPVKVIAGYTPDTMTESQLMSKNYTAEQLENIAKQFNETNTQLHAWNMIQIDNKWYHQDNTWVDTEGGKDGTSSYNALYFLGNDSDFSRSRAWLRSEYPNASSDWWSNGNVELKNFIRAYLETQIYDYPMAKSTSELEQYIQQAFDSGRSSQTFRLNQGLLPYNSFPELKTAKALANSSYAEYRVPPVSPVDNYVMTLIFRGRNKDVKETIPSSYTQITVLRGDVITPSALLRNPSEINDKMKIIALSPEILNATPEGIRGIKEGKGFVGIYTRDAAAIVMVNVKAHDLSVTLNGEILNLDSPPKNLQGRVLVPLRGIMEAMGADVSYDSVKREISAERGNASLKLVIDSTEAVINGELVILDVSPTLIDNKTYVPARIVAECLGATVKWNGEKNTVEITDPTLEEEGNEEEMENSNP